MKTARFLAAGSLSILCAACAAAPLPIARPAEDYARQFRSPTPQMLSAQSGYWAGTRTTRGSDPRASVRLVADANLNQPGVEGAGLDTEQDSVTNLGPRADTYVYQSQMGNTRQYTGPLNLGEPGLTASLWQESGRSNNLFRDERAWQTMDLITILVTEDSEGKKEAKTDTKSEFSLTAAIKQFLGVPQYIEQSNPTVNPEAMIDAETSRKFKGEAETSRKGKLKAKISAVVVEVLPGDILRVSGEKIISVNDEEQVMVISGLIRPKDINTRNEVDSSKLAQLRIDYYGRGTVGDYQSAGWLSGWVSKLWPF